MGIGHLSRCHTLALCLRGRGLDPRFLCRPLPGDQRSLLQDHGFGVDDIGAETTAADADRLAAEAEGLDAQWVVLDHPGFGLDYEKRFRGQAGTPLAVIDGQFRTHDCDLLLNPNVYATRENCRPTVPADCEVLAGYEYFLLRESFRIARGRGAAQARNVLVTLGGADPDNLTLAICRQLPALPADVIFHIVLGPANRHADSVVRYVSESADPRFRLHHQPADFAERLARCTVCVSAGGITMGEAAYLGVPVIALVIAENQRRTVKTLAARDAVVASGISGVGDAVAQLLGDTDRREALANALGGLVDGAGAERVATHLLARSATTESAICP